MNSIEAVKKVFDLLLLLQLSTAEIIQTEDGPIEGSLKQTRKSEQFNSFHRIPFAEPAVGDLRFRAPIAKTPWTNVLDCKSFGPMCMQVDPSGNNATSEDCLHLNVFTKNIPSVVNTQLKPVIVFFHGGGFERGSAIEQGPDYLLDRDVVLVTVNYRLGVFGFLAVETPEVSGNGGLKDQVLALKWIQNNIRQFGGDPSKVTVTGLSAGAYSITAHMVSPMAQGLFHNVIAVSGAIAWQLKLKSNNIDDAKALALRVACPTDNINEMVSCLKNKSEYELADNMVFSFYECPVMTWVPVVEQDFGQERFLTDEPNKLFAAGNFSKVNVMIGITADEYASPAAGFLNDANLTQILNDNFNEIAPKCFSFEGNDFKSSSEAAEILRDAYFSYDTIDMRSFNNLQQLSADGIIGYGVHRFVNFVRNLTDVYYYKFSFTGRFSRFYYPNEKIPFGAHHVDDIQYLFNAPYVGSLIEVSDPESFIVERMTRIWEQFAWTGNPNNITDEYLSEMVWPKHVAASEYYLEIGNNLVAKNGLFLERYSVWDNLESSSLMIEAKFLIIFISSLVKLLN